MSYIVKHPWVFERDRIYPVGQYDSLRVIGNIHDNPELLEAENDGK
jgi:hypothetical protein